MPELEKGFDLLRKAVGKSYKMRTEKKNKKKKIPYVLIKHKKDLLGTSYTNWIRGLLSELTTNWHELDYEIAATKPLQPELLTEIPLKWRRQ